MARQARVDFVYPPGASGWYPQPIIDTAVQFVRLLFVPDRLGEVADQNFVEHVFGKVTLHTLAELQRYRRGFGRPVLLGATMYAIPPRLALGIPGTHRPYTIDHLLELHVRIQTNDLPPNLQSLFQRNTRIEILVRLREPYDIRRNGNRPMVYGRALVPMGAHGFLDTHGAQNDFVADQVRYFAANRRTMMRAGLVTPMADIHRENFPELYRR